MVAYVVGASPFVAWFVLAALTTSLGCQVNEAGVNPCRIGDSDIGPFLYGIGEYVTLVAFTFPIYLLVTGVLFMVSAESTPEDTKGE